MRDAKHAAAKQIGTEECAAAKQIATEDHPSVFLMRKKVKKCEKRAFYTTLLIDLCPKLKYYCNTGIQIRDKILPYLHAWTFKIKFSSYIQRARDTVPTVGQ